MLKHELLVKIESYFLTSSPAMSIGIDSGGMGDISPWIFDKGDGLCNHPPYFDLSLQIFSQKSTDFALKWLIFNDSTKILSNFLLKYVDLSLQIFSQKSTDFALKWLIFNDSTKILSNFLLKYKILVSQAQRELCFFTHRLL